MIIFGTTLRAKNLGVAYRACARCHSMAAQRIEQRQRWFSLFFVPVFPFAKRFSLTCAACGTVTDLSEQEAGALLAAPDPAIPQQYGMPPRQGGIPVQEHVDTQPAGYQIPQQGQRNYPG